jgi:hypothetical protein
LEGARGRDAVEGEQRLGKEDRVLDRRVLGRKGDKGALTRRGSGGKAGGGPGRGGCHQGKGEREGGSNKV